MSNIRLFRLAGIPVTVSVWFFVLVGFMGATAGSVAAGVMWISAVFIGLLIHEFGHALVAKYYRLRPSIVLHGWGGLCHHAPARTAGQDILITAAGPGAGLIVGGILYASGAHQLTGPSPGSLSIGLYYLTWINIVWSLANLIPLWPLDGGQIFQVVMRSKRGTSAGDKLTHTVGVGLAGLLLFMMLVARELFLTVLLAILLYENLKKLKNPNPKASFATSQSGHAPAYGGRLGFDWRPTPIVRRLLWLTGGIWLMSALLNAITEATPMVAGLYDAFHLHPKESTTGFHLWQFFSYMWLHDLNALAHIFGNMLGLFILGPLIERALGGYRFLKLYLQCGLGAGLFTVILGWLFPATFGQPVVGASGALFGLVAALSIIMPREKMLLFFVAPIEARWLIWLVLGVDTLAFATNPESDLAWQTHVGGALTAWLVIHRYWDLRLLWDRWRLWRIGRGPRRPKRPDLRVLPGGKDDPPSLH